MHLALSWPIVTVLGLIWAAVAAVAILLQRRSAAATIAWLLVLALLPVLGLVLYRLIGPLRLDRKKLRRRVNRKQVADALRALAAIEDESPELAQLAMVPISVGEAPPLWADRVEAYFDGVSAYAAIGEAIEQARHHLHLEYYIWEPDRIGTRLRDQLAAKARSGVEVRLIIDGAGSRQLSRKFLRPLRDAGVELAWFNPVSLRRLRRGRADFRTHRKIVVCDGQVGFTGGMNITDAHSAELCPTYWRDTHLRIEGSAVGALQRVFIEDWLFAAERLIEWSRYAPQRRSAPGAGGQVVQIVSSGPDSDGFAIHKVYFTAINQADRRVWVTTPYFVPDEPILAALIGAALRKVDVRLLIPKKGDSRLIDLAARSYFPELVAAGVQIHEYEPRFIHAKTLVADDDVAIVGTANMDNRSYRLNFEVVAVAYGAEINGALARAYEADLRESRVYGRGDLERQPLRRRLGQAGARLLSPLL